MARDGNGRVLAAASTGAITVLPAAVCALVGALGLAREIWLDEAASLRIVRSATLAEWTNAYGAGSHLIAYPLVATLWSVVSDAVPWLRVLSLVCLALTAAVTSRWARDASGSIVAALAAGLLVASSPFLLRYGVELRGYALLSLSATCAGWLTWRHATHGQDRRWSWPLLGALLLVVSVHPTGILLLPGLVALSWLCSPVAGRARSVPWAVLSVAGLVGGFEVVARLGTVSGDTWWMPSLTADLFVRSLAELVGWGGVPFALVLLAGHRHWKAWLPIAASAVTLWILVAAVTLAFLPIWWPRVLVPALPCLFVAVAVAWNGLARPMRLAGAVLLTLVMIDGSSQWLRTAGDSIEPWSEALADMNPTSRPVIVLAMPEYVDLVLRHGFGADPGLVVRAPVGGAADRARGATDAALERARAAGAMGLAVRVDLTLARDPDAPVRLVRRLLDGLDRPVELEVGLVLSPDATLVPSLAHDLDALDAALVRTLGTPARTAAGARWRRATWLLGQRPNQERLP